MRNPSDAIIHSMCREFNVNETWLRSGKGEMFLPQEDEVSEIVSHLLDESNPFYDMILDIMHTFNNLDDKGQEIICNFTSDLVDRMAKKENKEEEFKNKVQQIINIMNVCGNLVLVQDEKEILRLITCGDIGLAEELFENIKKELSEVITES